jgi:uncharacterized protein (TIGR02996 family)
MENKDLQKIIKNPEDIRTRLLYAEKLENDKNPYGTFIRLQCELSQLPPDSVEIIDLECKLAKIKIDPKWTDDLIAVGLKTSVYKPKAPWYYAPPWTFRNGFVYHLFTPPEVLIKHGETITKNHPITSLAIHKAKADEASAIAELPWLAAISSVSTTGSDSSLVKIFKSNHLKKLERLHLSCSASALLKLLSLSALQNLHYLSLDIVDNLHDAMMALCDYNPSNLQTLRLGSEMKDWGSATGQRSQKVIPPGDAYIKLLSQPYMQKIESLSLYSKSIRPQDKQTVAAITKLKALKSLTISFEKDTIAAPLLNNEIASHLESLDIIDSPSTMIKTFPVTTFTKLKSLSIEVDWDEIDPADSKYIHTLLTRLKMPQLQELSLKNFKIDTKCFSLLSDGRLPELKSLHCDSEMEPEAVKELSPISNQLISLYLNCDDNLPAVEHICKLPLSNLRRLLMYFAPRGEDTINALQNIVNSKHYPMLTQLEFGSMLTDERAQILLDAQLTNLSVLYINAESTLSTPVKKALEKKYFLFIGADPSSRILPWVSKGYMEA